MPGRRLYLGTVSDSRRWDAVEMRPDDVTVVTPPKSGTTWMQTILALLLSGDPEVEPELGSRMPWVDFRHREIGEVAARLEAMDGRRAMKSHTPLDGLPFHDRALYICVFRHPLDAHVSFRSHVRNLPMALFDPWYPEGDPSAAFRRFLGGAPDGPDGDALSLAHILRHHEAAMALSQRPNVHLFHYADMTRDLPGAFARLSRLLGMSHEAATMDRLVRSATLENMRRHAQRYTPSGGKGFVSDAAFFPRGGTGNWHGVLTEGEVAAYDAAMDRALGPRERLWLEHGAPGRAGP